MMIPKKKRKPDKKHLNWIVKQPCVVMGDGCKGPIQAHHVRMGSMAGMSTKPDDSRCVPLCMLHHRRLHDGGQKTFDKEHEVSLASKAMEYWLRSPARRKD